MSAPPASDPAIQAATFRLLYLDPLTGWVDHYDEFEAVTNDTAIGYARGLHAGQRLEHDRLLQLPPDIIR